MSKIILYTDHAEIEIYYKGELFSSLIDLEDVEKASKYTWNLCSRLYVKTRGISLHRLIMNFPKDLEVDHINRNPLDNRKCNLRLATRAINNINRGLHKNSSSGYKGVNWCKKSKSWQAMIYHNNTNIYLGKYKNKDDAIKARKDAELFYYKDICTKL